MPKTFKIVILGIFPAGMGTLFWFFVHAIFFGNAGVAQHFWSPANIGIFSLLLLLYSLSISIAAFLVAEILWAYGILLLSAASYLLFAPLTIGTLIAFALFAITVILMREWVQKDIASRLEISIERAVAPNIFWIFTALAMAVSTAFYASPAVKQLKDIQIPREVFQQIIKPVEFAFLPASEMQSVTSVGASAVGAPVGIIENIQKAAGDEIRKVFHPFAENAPPAGFYSEFSNAFYEAVNSKIAGLSSLPPKTQQILSLSLAIMLFTSIRLLAIPVGWMMLVLAMISYNILSYVGFVKTRTVQVEKEVLEM
jgi:hypothetical protein